MNRSSESRPRRSNWLIIALIGAPALLVALLAFLSSPAEKNDNHLAAAEAEQTLPPAKTVDKHTGPAAPPGVVRLRGSPVEIGRQHGTKLREEIGIVIREYIQQSSGWEMNREKWLARVRVMKAYLPVWYMEELNACAKAAGVDPDVLLYAQCEGDIRSLNGCTTYVAFGDGTSNGQMEIGRSFDYWGLRSTQNCAVILAVKPRPEDGYAFVGVGWAGILGGWTFINEKGLFVANNLGGFYEKNPKGIPTLILERIIAQKAATLDEALAIVRALPRMRGQALVIGQVADPATGRKADAAVVEYGAKTVRVTRHEDGLAFHSSIGTPRSRIKSMLFKTNRKPMDTIRSAGSGITLHSVVIKPLERAIWVAHGRATSAHLGEYVKYDLDELFK